VSDTRESEDVMDKPRPQLHEMPFLGVFMRLLRARLPLIYITTWEEERLLGELIDAAESVQPPRAVYSWNLVDGIAKFGEAPEPDTADPVVALGFIERVSEPALFCLKDFHVHLREERAECAHVTRKLREIVPALKGDVPKCVVIVAPSIVIPEALEKDVTTVRFALPDAVAIRDVLRRMTDRAKEGGRVEIALDAEAEDRLVHAALGLTLQEAETAFARAIVNDDRLDAADVDVILDEKRQIIARTEILEFIRPEGGLDEVGGLENLKHWLLKRSGAWLPEAARYGVPFPKGLLIAGVPGCGKSLTAKCVSATWELPLLRLDVGRIFDQWIGSSERRMRSALQTAEAIAPSILWIDEIEKGFSGASGSSNDSGTTMRVFGSFLTWMQEKSKPVFVIATANNVDVLPPEFLRKGRFDEIFFVDLPTADERRRIFEIQLERRRRHQAVMDELELRGDALDELVELTHGYSGAEIEQVIISALFEAFAERRALRLEDIRTAISETNPYERAQGPALRALRSWANERQAVRATRNGSGGDATGAPVTKGTP
jgi:ATP-dependent 26S proteasome regulatory subunit